MAIDPITTSGPTITVSTLQEMNDAYEQLSHQAGGGTILLEGGDYGVWSKYAYGAPDGTEPVVIKSADPGNPAKFHEIYLRAMENIRFESITVDGTDLGAGVGTTEFYIYASKNIQVVDSKITFDEDNTIKDSGALADSAFLIRDSSGILLQENYVAGHMFGISMTNTTNSEVIGNEVTNVQGDGFRGGGLQNVEISGNYMHNFYGVDQNITHSDMIQIWGSNAYLLTENLTISGNVLIADDDASQAIFIRNEEFGKVGDSTNGHFQNITITDNLIYNGHLHGIHVGDAQYVTIESNTVLWNQDATLSHGGNPGVNFEPMIVVRNALNVGINDNIVGNIVAPDAATLTGNQTVIYDNPGKMGYVGNHFVNPLAGAGATYSDVFMLTSSPWYGTVGSPIGNTPEDITDGVRAVLIAAPSEDDRYELTFDASLSEDKDGQISEADGYSFTWTFEDGTSLEGISVTRTFEDGGFKPVNLKITQNGEVVVDISRNFGVESKDLFGFDFEDGVVDVSDGAPNIVDNGAIVDSGDGSGLLIGDGRNIQIDRGTAEIYSLDAFGLALDLQPTGDEPSGTFLHLYKTMTGYVDGDGYVGFSLSTDMGEYSLKSREPVFDDGEAHRIGIAFNGETGQLELFADGESVSSTEAWGTTAPATYYNLIFGNTFHDSMDAILDNIEMSIDPGVAGALPEVAPPAPEPEVSDEPETPEVTPPAPEPEASGEPETPEVTPPAPEPEASEEPETPEVTPPAPAPAPEAEEPEALPPSAPDVPDTRGDGGRGTEPDPIESDGGGNILSQLIDALLSLFNLGSDDDNTDARTVASVESETADAVLLTDIVPVTASADSEASCGCEDEEDDAAFDAAA